MQFTGMVLSGKALKARPSRSRSHSHSHSQQGSPKACPEATDPQPLWPGMEFNTVGVVVAKYHGVHVADLHGAETHWREKASEVIEMINDDARVFEPRSIEGRQHLARGRYLGRLAYTFKYQVPEETVVDVADARAREDSRGGAEGAPTQRARDSLCLKNHQHCCFCCTGF